jgi:hypothetical protein
MKRVTSVALTVMAGHSLSKDGRCSERPMPGTSSNSGAVWGLVWFASLSLAMTGELADNASATVL